MHERDENISVWFNQKKEEIEQSYLVCSDKYMQSGWSSTPERWMRARRVILNAIPCSGAFLDIGCANGLLLECLVRWASEDGMQLEPHGIDFSEDFVELARARLTNFVDNLAVANAYSWQPKRFSTMYIRCWNTCPIHCSKNI
jgi:ubiquinone/menaquinone biosynthesis C-methylase UbiE